MYTISVASTEYVRYRVNATVNGNSGYNPTGDTVQFGFTGPGNTAPTSWVSGSWETDNSAGTFYVAKCLVGPAGTATLPVGTYYVWLKITDSPEAPVKQPGQLKIY